MIGDMSGMQVVLGANANPLHTAADFARSLISMVEEKKLVSFYAQHVSVQNAEWLERAAKETHLKPAQITSALTNPTAVGAAIVSLTIREQCVQDRQDHVLSRREMSCSVHSQRWNNKMQDSQNRFAESLRKQ